MVTGDNEITAHNIANKISIDEVWAGVSPEKSRYY